MSAVQLSYRIPENPVSKNIAVSPERSRSTLEAEVEEVE